MVVWLGYIGKSDQEVASTAYDWSIHSSFPYGGSSRGKRESRGSGWMVGRERIPIMIMIKMKDDYILDLLLIVAFGSNLL